jgi:hypothetical protein
VFRDRQPNVEGNALLRTPQRMGYAALAAAAANPDGRELGVVLPVGCGKSCLLAITPFAFRARRVLVIAPNVSCRARRTAGSETYRMTSST